jgi:hypothetical protein
MQAQSRRQPRTSFMRQGKLSTNSIFLRCQSNKKLLDRQFGYLIVEEHIGKHNHNY